MVATAVTTTTIALERPLAVVTRRYDEKAALASTNPAAGGLDCVHIHFTTRTEAIAFARAFWAAMKLPWVNGQHDDYFVGQITHRGDRSNIAPELAGPNEGKFKFAILANWLPLTNEAKAWLKQNTELKGSLD